LRGHLEQMPLEYDAVVATYFASVYWLPRQSGSGCAFGYYIQDFEPRFFAETDHNHSIALASYAWSNELKLFTKTLWNQRAVADATGRIPTVIGPSVNVDLFMPSEERALAPDDRPLRIAAMLRPASRYRAAPRTVAVLEEVVRDRGHIEVHAFGTSDDLLAQQDLTRGWITNHGHLAPRKLAALLGQCDIFVDFSDYQAMGLTLLEAMASGCAVIGPREGGATSFLRDGVNALVADTASNEDCIKQASRLVDDATLRTNLQRRAIDDANLHVPEAAALNMLTALFGGA
jgi:glycosyltransferase involved in cell wall biosynthesis